MDETAKKTLKQIGEEARAKRWLQAQEREQKRPFQVPEPMTLERVLNVLDGAGDTCGMDEVEEAKAFVKALAGKAEHVRFWEAWWKV
jgi:hypothetical protein